MKRKQVAVVDARIEAAKANAKHSGVVAREYVDQGAKHTAYGVKLSACVVGGFLRGFFRK
jgi:hypothetical protein